MILICLFWLTFLTSCSSSWLGLADDVFDNVITVQIQKEAIKSDVNVRVNVEIIHQ